MKTVCGHRPGAPGEAPHRVNTLVHNLREAKELKNLPLSPRMNPRGERHTIRELWEACTNNIPVMDTERKQGGRQKKQKAPEPQNTSAFGKNQGKAPTKEIHLCSKHWYYHHSKDREIQALFTQGINSIAEKLHCKNHSCLQPQMRCLNFKIKMLKRGKQKTGQMPVQKLYLLI